MADADQPYVWLTTTGRRSGQPHTVELWFIPQGSTVFFLSGGGEGADWVRNADHQPRVTLRLGANDYQGTARRPVSGGHEEVAVRRAMAAKYQGWREGQPLSRWAARSLCLAVELEIPDRTMEPTR